MRPTYIQVAMDVIEQAAPDVAAELDLDEAAVGWGLVRMIRWAIGRCPDNQPPSASAVVTGPAAAKQIARAASYAGDPEAFVDALERVQPKPLLERVEGGIRIRGLDRYDAMWGKGNPVKWAEWKSAHPEKYGPAEEQKKARAGSGPGPNRKRPKADPQEEEKEEEEPLPSEERGEGQPTELFEPSASSPGKPEDLLALWNRLAPPTLPRAEKLTASRRRAAAARLREMPLAQWEGVVRRIVASPFCRGERNRDGRSWRADLDFLLRPDTAVKVLEGKYDEAGAQHDQAPGSAPAPALPDTPAGHAWERALDRLREAGVSYGLSQAPLEPVALEAGVLTLSAANPEAVEWLQEHYGGQLADALAADRLTLTLTCPEERAA